MKLVRTVPLPPWAWTETPTGRGCSISHHGPTGPGDTPGGIQRVCADVVQWEVTAGWTLPLLDLPAASDFQKHPRKSSASQDQSPA